MFGCSVTAKGLALGGGYIGLGLQATQMVDADIIGCYSLRQK
jgi:hypothetical protein